MNESRDNGWRAPSRPVADLPGTPESKAIASSKPERSRRGIIAQPQLSYRGNRVLQEMKSGAGYGACNAAAGRIFAYGYSIGCAARGL